jgi:hypothetical protein
MSERDFWQAVAGCWAGEGSYFDGDMRPLCAAYGIVMEITIDAARVLTWREWKQYPPGQLARSAAGGKLDEGSGFEKATTQVGKLGTDGTLDFFRMGVFRSVDRHSAVRDLPDPQSGAPRYRTWHTLTSPDVLATSQFGIHFTAFESDYDNRPVVDPATGAQRPNPLLGQIKGISLFRYRRIERPGLEASRAERRARFEVPRAAD